MRLARPSLAGYQFLRFRHALDDLLLKNFYPSLLVLFAAVFFLLGFPIPFRYVLAAVFFL